MPCQICGKYSGKYPLCKEHYKMLNEGEIEICDQCGEYHYTDELCECEEYKELPTEGFEYCVVCGTATNGYAFCKRCWKEYSTEEMLDILNERKYKQKNKENKDKIIEFDDKEEFEDEEEFEEDYEEQNYNITINENNKSKCITCGKKTDGLLFCPNCYRKYKNKELLFKITNCTNIELLDEGYEGRYTCKDGHVVKSKSERAIDDYLFEHNIAHAYERELSYGASEKEVLHPDFLLPNYLGQNKHVYIEHWGYNENNVQYTKTKKFKIPIYKKLGITLVCTYEKTDMGKIDTVLDRKLNKTFIKENEINFEEK